MKDCKQLVGVGGTCRVMTAWSGRCCLLLIGRQHGGLEDRLSFSLTQRSKFIGQHSASACLSVCLSVNMLMVDILNSFPLNAVQARGR